MLSIEFGTAKDDEVAKVELTWKISGGFGESPLSMRNYSQRVSSELLRGTYLGGASEDVFDLVA